MSPAYPRTPASTHWESPRSQRSGTMEPSPILYDRTGQVGLGELATPRWMLAQGSNESLMTPPSAPLPRRALLQDTSIPESHAASASSTVARHARAISYSIDDTGGKAAPAPLPSFTSMQFDKRMLQEASYGNEVTHMGRATDAASGRMPEPAPPAPHPSLGPTELLPPPMMQGLHQTARWPTSEPTWAELMQDIRHLDVSDTYAAPSTTQPVQQNMDDVFMEPMPPMMPTTTYPSAEGSGQLSERAAFSRLERDASFEPAQWESMPTSTASPLSSSMLHTFDPTVASPSPKIAQGPPVLSPPPPPELNASPRVSKSPRWRRESASTHLDEKEESGSLAGRLSRRSLMALGSIFKVSPRRDKAKDENKQESPDADVTTTPSRASRISFSRRRRQSTQQPPMPRELDAVHAGPHPEGQEAPPSSLPMPSASKAGQREPTEAAPVTKPSPYHTAKAQGSRIPRASSMVRLLHRRPPEQDDVVPDVALPVSTSMQSVQTVGESPLQPRSAARTSLASGPPAQDTGSPAKSAAVRKSYASGEAMEALRRQRHLAATPKEKGAHRVRPSERLPGSVPLQGSGPRMEQTKHVSSQREEASEALRRSREEAALKVREADAALERTGSPRACISRAGESGIPVPVDVRRRSSSVQSRRTLRTPTLVDDTAAADEEMERHVQRFFRRKLTAGARLEDLDKQFTFPQPTAPSKRLSPRQAEVIYGNHLCPYEVQEMKEYENIYYVGSFARHKHYAVPSKPERNYGYDDERGDYIVNMRDHIAYRYEIIKVLGRGSFGQVLQCRDHKTGKYVAIKLIRNKRRFHHQAVVEVKIMKHLTEADADNQHHVIHMSDSFTFRHHLCVTMDLLSINLYELIKANNFEGFSTTLIRRFAYQTLTSLSLMGQARIVHCDLKPENILLVHPRRSEIRVIDFGSSCFDDEKVYTYIQSRFYRSPEVILGIDYHMAIDMWSLGCILVELHTGYPLFPGENEQDQLACMMEVLGVPDDSLLERSTRRKLFFDSTGAPRPVVTSRGHKRRPNSKNLYHAMRSNDELFLDFVARCLTWDPERRLQPEAALRHPWFQQRAESSAMARGPTLRRPPRSDVASLNGSQLPRATPARPS
ncbi:hypothetical protein MNAN1_003364 [Malassezia nana]|uniref:dual-specificity kinase n=1 Tax=Malassezia nana TaxID=180528 RepID=A0AAF0EM59_9BASI|nr:hypothetical protein MNAN1_003364 [Malassezia nana]